MAELHGRKPLFPGDDYIKQMNLIFSVLGTPSKSDMKFITNEKALEYIKSLKKQAPIAFSKLYPNANPLALDLLAKMLVFNPHSRISVEEALGHPYFHGLARKESEVECKTPFDFRFEKMEMTKEVIQELMWQEVQFFRPELRGKTWRLAAQATNTANPAPSQPTANNQPAPAAAPAPAPEPAPTAAASAPAPAAATTATAAPAAAAAPAAPAAVPAAQ